MKTRIKTNKIALRIGLALLSGLLFPLAFPPVGWGLLVIPALVALFVAIRNASPRWAFCLGMLQGMTAYGIALSWFFNIFGTASITFYALMALFVALFCLLANIFQRHNESILLNVLFAAMLWTAIEYYRCELFFLRFAWITPGAALGPTVLSPIVGVYGTSFLVVATSAAFGFRKSLSLAGILLAVVLGIVWLRPGPVEPPRENWLAVTVVQSEDCFIDPYIELTLQAEKDDPDLIVWPEHALPYDVRKVERDYAMLTNLCARIDATLVVGTKTILGPVDFVGVGERNWHNTALVLDSDGVLGEYYKVRPVHFFNDGIPGNNIEPVQTSLGSIATPICFDGDYTEIARKMVDRGAQFFAVPSFDAKSWSAKQHLQHALLFRLRAAENARWLACAASSGVSQIIDPRGHVHASIAPMKTGVATHRIGRSTDKTVFTRFGWLFPWFAIVCSVAMLAHTAFSIISTPNRRRDR